MEPVFSVLRISNAPKISAILGGREPSKICQNGLLLPGCQKDKEMLKGISDASQARQEANKTPNLNEHVNLFWCNVKNVLICNHVGYEGIQKPNEERFSITPIHSLHLLVCEYNTC